MLKINHKITALLLLFTAYCFAQETVNKSVYDYQTKDYQAKKTAFINALLSKMTLDEKIGQLNLPGAGDITTGQTPNTGIAKKIEEGKVGGLFNIKGVEKIKEVQKIAVEKSRLKIPLIFGMDVVHGYETNFPIPLGLASSWDMNLIQKSARIAANEASSDGVNWTFSPMVDLSKDPRWGRIAEGSGEDAYLGAEIAKAMVFGYQGEDLSLNNTIMACMKHFALYGAVESGRDYNTVDMSHVRMYNDYFPPYKAAVEAGAGSVMAAFNEVDGIPSTGNKWLLTEVLRNQWKFKGFVVTDFTGINEMIDHGMGDLQQTAALAMNAGINMDMVGEGFLTTLKKSLQEGKVNIKQIDAATKRILEAKYDLGLFDDPYRYCDPSRAKSEVYSQANRDVARYIAANSIVLMKNSGEILPLKSQKNIAVIGPLADNAENMPGTWSVAAKHKDAISLLKGLKDTFGNSVNFTYAKGSNVDYDPVFEEKAAMFGKNTHRDSRSKEEILKEAVEVANKADVILLAIGETSEMSGESSSRTNISIPQSQKDLLKELKKTGKPIVLVLFTGRPLVLNEEKELADAILNVWFPGSEAGLAISDVLYGKVNPSGKLPMTFPRSVGQIPIYYSHKNTGRPLSDDKTDKCIFEKFRSNYLDECNTPLYPFGYGLSYTQFEYNNLNVSSKNLKGNQTLKVSVELKNSGKYDGAEIVQLYIRDLVGSNTRPVKELKNFQKVFLKSGESKIVTFNVTPEDLKFYDNNLKYDWESGEFEMFIGGDSQKTISQKVTWNK